MRVSISQGKGIPIKSSTPVTSHDSSVYLNDAERIRDERILTELVNQIEKMQRQNVQHEETVRSANPNINDDGVDNHLLRAFCADMANQVHKGNDSLEPKWFQPPNAVVQQPEMDFGTASGNYMKKNTAKDFGVRQKNQAGPTTEQQLQQQNQMILELQKQMQGLLEIHLQQQQQRFSNEEAMRRMQEKNTHESAVKEVESMQTQPEIDEIGMVSMDNSLPLPASNECLDGPESLPLPTLQRIPKRTEGSKVAINEKEQQQVNDGVEIYNVAVPKNSSVYVRQNSTMYSCKDCGKEFTHKGSINRHLKIHTGEKPFKCGECDRAFARADDLRVHQRSHSGEKPFKCQICNAAFTQKSNLSRHLLIHTNEKPFLCDICQLWFARKSTLSEHMKIHSGLKPWQCNVCQKLFRQKSSLNRHRKLHSGDED